VKVAREADQVMLVVEDDGVGWARGDAARGSRLGRKIIKDASKLEIGGKGGRQGPAHKLFTL
jgi:two-component sensor histidine kinase